MSDRFPPLVSPVHSLARLSTISLRAKYLRLVGGAGGARAGELASAYWDRDQLITAIRDIEAPDNGRTRNMVWSLANARHG